MNGSLLDHDELVRESDRLRTFLQEHTGEDHYFDILLGRPLGHHPPHVQDIFEKDRLDLFLGIVDRLIELLGDEDQAAQWLFHNRGFTQMGKDSPFDYLRDGEFDALWLLHDLLDISVKRRLANSVSPDSTLNPVEAALPSKS